jgi:hypothetical protein
VSEKRSFGRMAAGAGLVLLGGPAALFTAVDLALFLLHTPPGRWVAGVEAARMPVAVVVLLFAGLVAAYGWRMIAGELRKGRGGA